MWAWIVARWSGSRRSIRRIMRGVLVRRLVPIALTILAGACSSFTSDEAPSSSAPDAGGSSDASPDDASPGPVPPDPPVAVSAGGGIGCVLRKSGAVDCWGDNADGAITSVTAGQDTCAGLTPSCVPVATRSPLVGRALQISVGDGFVCAVVAGNPSSVMCWGKDRVGTLGRAYVDSSSSVPIPVPLAGPALEVAAGRGNACARVLVGGTIRVQCWGTSTIGINGKGPSVTIEQPVVVDGVDGSSTLSLSITDPASACVLDGQNLVRCWGGNAYGSLGRSPENGGCSVDGPYASGTYPCSSSPQLARSMDPTNAIATGVFTTCALRTSGALACWGFNGWGGHAIGTIDNGAHDAAGDATRLAGKPARLTGRSGHFCAVLEDGRVQCWGAAGQGQLGPSLEEPVAGEGFARRVQPVPQTIALEGVTDISAGEDFTLAIAGGEVYAWGTNGRGQLGHAPDQDQPFGCDGPARCNGTPTRVALPQLAVAR